MSSAQACLSNGLVSTASKNARASPTPPSLACTLPRASRETEVAEELRTRDGTVARRVIARVLDSLSTGERVVVAEGVGALPLAGGQLCCRVPRRLEGVHQGRLLKVVRVELEALLTRSGPARGPREAGASIARSGVRCSSSGSSSSSSGCGSSCRRRAESAGSLSSSRQPASERCMRGARAAALPPAAPAPAERVSGILKRRSGCLSASLSEELAS